MAAVRRIGVRQNVCNVSGFNLMCMNWKRRKNLLITSDKRSEEFKNIIPVLDTFHTQKTLLKCTGKYLSGSGAGTIWLEAGMFGPTIIENSVLNGGHYTRSLTCMQVLAEAMQRLLYKEFFTENNAAKYLRRVSLIKELKTSVAENDIVKSQELMDEIIFETEVLQNDIKAFVDKRSKENENFN